MSNAVLTRPDEVQWDQFYDHGFLIQQPDTNSIWGGYGQSDSSDLSFFHTRFFKANTEYFYPKVVFRLDKAELLQQLEKSRNNPIEIKEVENFDESFKKDLTQVLQDIKSSQSLKKVVPVAMAKYKHEKGRLLDSILMMAEVQGSIYGHWNKNSGIIGCSPEPLFWRENNRINFVALAGTAKRSEANAKEKLLSSEKDKIEHFMVVEDIKNKLSSIGLSQIYTSDLNCVEYGDLLHLETKIWVEDITVTNEQLISALHPTAALCGYPQKESLEYLKNLGHFKFEEETRSFGGVFGIDTPDKSWSFVMIRNFQWQKEDIYIQSGCGVVAQSEVEKELAEIRNKRESVRRFLK